MIVREVTKLLSSKSYIRYLDMAFFIRPDRYVASIIETKSMDSFFKIANIFQNKA